MACIMFTVHCIHVHVFMSVQDIFFLCKSNRMASDFLIKFHLTQLLYKLNTPRRNGVTNKLLTD